MTAHVQRTLESVGQFVRTMLAHRDRYPGDAMLVTYEALQDDPAPVVSALFRFLGVSDAPDIVARCIRQASFEAMGGRPAGQEQDRAFFRKGIKGDWRTTLTPELNEMILHHAGWMFPIFGWQP